MGAPSCGRAGTTPSTSTGTSPERSARISKCPVLQTARTSKRLAPRLPDTRSTALRARAGFLRLDAQGRMLAVHSVAGYEERGLGLTLSLGNPEARDSPSPCPHAGATPPPASTPLWQDQIYTRYAPPAPASADGDPAPNPPRRLDPRHPGRLRPPHPRRPSPQLVRHPQPRPHRPPLHPRRPTQPRHPPRPRQWHVHPRPLNPHRSNDPVAQASRTPPRCGAEG